MAGVTIVNLLAAGRSEGLPGLYRSVDTCEMFGRVESSRGNLCHWFKEEVRTEV